MPPQRKKKNYPQLPFLFQPSWILELEKSSCGWKAVFAIKGKYPEVPREEGYPLNSSAFLVAQQMLSKVTILERMSEVKDTGQRSHKVMPTPPAGDWKWEKGLRSRDECSGKRSWPSQFGQGFMSDSPIRLGAQHRLQSPDFSLGSGPRHLHNRTSQLQVLQMLSLDFWKKWSFLKKCRSYTEWVV